MVPSSNPRQKEFKEPFTRPISSKQQARFIQDSIALPTTHTLLNATLCLCMPLLDPHNYISSVQEFSPQVRRIVETCHQYSYTLILIPFSFPETFHCMESRSLVVSYRWVSTGTHFYSPSGSCHKVSTIAQFLGSVIILPS